MNIDDALNDLALSAVHPGLDGTAAGVFSRIRAEERAGRQARYATLVAIGVAGIAGAAGAAIPAGPPAVASIALMPTTLAPSTLLGGAE